MLSSTVVGVRKHNKKIKPKPKQNWSTKIDRNGKLAINGAHIARSNESYITTEAFAFDRLHSNDN